MARDEDGDLGTAFIALVATIYLATLAIGFVVFRAKPFVGGLAAVVAIVAGRGIQFALVTAARRRSRQGAPPEEPRP